MGATAGTVVQNNGLSCFVSKYNVLYTTYLYKFKLKNVLPGIATGLEHLLVGRGENRSIRGLHDLFGVSGGVAPFPLALDSPIAFTRSLTDTQLNSEPSLKMILIIIFTTKLIIRLYTLVISLFVHFGSDCSFPSFFSLLLGILGASDLAEVSPKMNGLEPVSATFNKVTYCGENVNGDSGGLAAALKSNPFFAINV